MENLKHKKSTFTVATTVIGICAANFIYQAAFADAPNYSVAIERSWFQAVALCIAWILW